MNDDQTSYQDDPEWREWRDYLQRQREKSQRHSLRSALLAGEDPLDGVPESPPVTDGKPRKPPTRSKARRDGLAQRRARSGRFLDGHSTIRIIFVPPDRPSTPRQPDERSDDSEK